MDKRKFMGLPQFHQCLSAIFPSEEDDADNTGRIDVGVGGGTSAGGWQDGENDTKPTSSEGSVGSPATATATTDPPCSRRRLPVKFTKTAVELLRETVNTFLKKVASELCEIDEATTSGHYIRPEQVTRVLLGFDDDDGDDDGDDAENDSNDETPYVFTRKNANGSLNMEKIVSQARNLLLQRKLEEKEQNAKSKTLEADANTKIEDGGNTNRMNEHPIESTTTSTHTNSGGRGSSASIAGDVATAETRTAVAQQRDKRKTPVPKKKKRKRKTVITAEMEAEQERLLKASKKAFDSSRHQDGGDGVTFRIVR
mmetsp:Transcript_22966/g.51036  ORF Transcript_22966/g.51036 Transcript_22966/m.51036 type:complete len:312 (+) Transcript_22966:151-1086(+)|eukprot:CAMPEP_0201262132 /NCGR_PEP_ID=MMETSP0853-20130426/6160_1 /ASSEMBLY_ACC=CAM_ASM_000640 /TAXON_ID=183588 /ORGANISM="Pseudo-nitzschia fraudulenta, Strain WWA7" /LENGTH=311 /DNA_ID=CAMNT_0047565315 /DNA_START=94 /DNA_END=1029 /DNA_ORIENTATION=+